MKLKNILLLALVLFSLNSFYRPAQSISLRYKHTIVKQISFDDDKLTDEILTRNREFFFGELVTLSAAILNADRLIILNNSS